ncbi:hypothetical protein Pcinc_008374 [Petrolisthes cinctipes]|uniref:RRM domain-containing protein n=1 Tax=Petrolisthes cinctipes TaxID=88211 RepID=A0AAE1G6R4_PETCI|nr:hypothetical protein Pcinc_008374 [Petrolisthes cinctipes]
MDTEKPQSLPRAVVDQALETSLSGRGKMQKAANKSRPSRSGLVSKNPVNDLNTLMLTNVLASFTYGAIHSIFKCFGVVLRIRITYDSDCRSNRSYITFNTNASAKAAFESKDSLTVGDTHCKVQMIRSINVVDSDNDYCPNIFDDSAEHVPKERRVPTPFWFVAYYREGRGNIIHASRYLEKEIGLLPMGHIKKYGKGVLIRAKDLTQAMMLLNLPCPSDSMFESIKPHRTFNYSKGRIYNEDLYEFSEEYILAMCPDSVQQVTKMKGSKNMIILTFYGSHIPDRININPTSFEVKPFVERPLQCFCCYEFGHGKRNCNNRSRCGNCSALDSHLTSECRSESYSFYCRDSHPLRSRQSPSQPSQEAAASCSSENVSKATLHNSFSVLETLSDTHSGDPSTDDNSQTLAKGVHVVEVHAATRSPKRKLKSPKLPQRRLRGSSEALDSIDVPPCEATISVDSSIVSSQFHQKRSRGSDESLDSTEVPPRKLPSGSSEGREVNVDATDVVTSKDSLSLPLEQRSDSTTCIMDVDVSACVSDTTAVQDRTNVIVSKNIPSHILSSSFNISDASGTRLRVPITAPSTTPRVRSSSSGPGLDKSYCLNKPSGRGGSGKYLREASQKSVLK